MKLQAWQDRKMKLCFYARIFYLCFGGGGLCYILENTVARAFILTIYSQSKKGLAALSVTRFSRSRNPCTCCSQPRIRFPPPTFQGGDTPRETGSCTWTPCGKAPPWECACVPVPDQSWFDSSILLIGGGLSPGRAGERAFPLSTDNDSITDECYLC